MFRKLFYALSWLVLIGCSTRDTLAQDGADQPGSADAKTTQRELVQLLGDPSFYNRERATEELANQGVAARDVLTEALMDTDIEIRLRARRILFRVNERAFESQLAAFIADVDDSRQLSLPGWKRFRDLVGDSRESREMFAAMTRSDGALLAAYEMQVPEVPAQYAARIALLQSQTVSGTSVPRVVSPPSLATLLLIGCDKSVKTQSVGMSQLYQLLCQPAAMQSIGTQAHSSVLRSLLEKWATCMASSSSSYGMMVSLKYDLKESGLQQATKLLEAGTPSSSSLHYAIITIGRFGGEEHVRLLKPLLENKTVCHRWGNRQLKKEGTINVEVRDAALVVLLRLTGRDPGEYGFKLLKENPETLYYVYTFGFVEDEEREAAHAKWAADSKADKS